MNNTLNTVERIRKPQVARHPWRTSDGQEHPVTVRKIDQRDQVLEQAADALTTLLVAVLDAQEPAKVYDMAEAGRAMRAPEGSRGVCGCGTPVTKVWHPALGDKPRWIHDAGGCSMVTQVHDITTH